MPSAETWCTPNTPCLIGGERSLLIIKSVDVERIWRMCSSSLLPLVLSGKLGRRLECAGVNVERAATQTRAQKHDGAHSLTSGVVVS